MNEIDCLSDKEKIRKALDRFLISGLITKDIDSILDVICDRILGIGIGEQGFVTSKEDVRRVLQTGKKRTQKLPTLFSMGVRRCFFIRNSLQQLVLRLALYHRKKGSHAQRKASFYSWLP